MRRFSARTISAPAWITVLFLASAALGAWFLIGPAIAHTGRYYTVGYNRTTFEYDRQTLLVFIPYALALWAWRRGSRVPLWALLGGAVVLHVLVLFAPLPQSQDFYQYLFYGKMQAAHHANPYLVAPNTFWADRWLAWVRWRSQTSVYGPVWMLVTLGVAKVAGSSLAVGFVTLKLLILAADIAVMGLIVAIARRGSDPIGRAGWGLLVFAWNPLVLVNVPLGGAVDVVLAAAFLGAYLARRRNHLGVATVLLTLASLVKAYAVVALLLHLALIVRERGWPRGARHAATAGAIGVAAFAPYWSGPRILRGIAEATGLTNLSLTGTIQRLLVPVVRAVGLHEHHVTSHIVHALAAAALVAVLVWAVRRVRTERDLWTTLLAVLAAYLLLTPWFLPWYAVGALALVAVLPWNRLTVPLLVFTGTSMAVLWTPSHTPDWVWASILHYVPPIVVYAGAALREVRRADRRGLELVGGAPRPLTLPVPSGARWEPAAK